MPGVPLVLALLGLLSLAGIACGGTATGTSALDAADATAAGDPALLRSTSRLFGIQAAQPFCKAEDGNDNVEPEAAGRPTFPSGGGPTAAAEPHPATEATPRLRPLQDRPQSPRAPPHLV